MSPLSPKKILLIKHGSLGDIVFALEPILAIRNKFNNSVIDLVTEEKFIPFFKKINTAVSKKLACAHFVRLGASRNAWSMPPGR